jgi:hypothetical protein
LKIGLHLVDALEVFLFSPPILKYNRAEYRWLIFPCTKFPVEERNNGCISALEAMMQSCFNCNLHPTLEVLGVIESFPLAHISARNTLCDFGGFVIFPSCNPRACFRLESDSLYDYDDRRLVAGQRLAGMVHGAALAVESGF